MRGRERASAGKTGESRETELAGRFSFACGGNCSGEDISPGRFAGDCVLLLTYGMLVIYVGALGRGEEGEENAQKCIGRH